MFDIDFVIRHDPTYDKSNNNFHLFHFTITFFHNHLVTYLGIGNLENRL